MAVDTNMMLNRRIDMVERKKQVSTDMVCSIASLVAVGVNGVEKMFMRLSDEIIDAFYPSAVSKGVKVVELEEGYAIDLHVITKQGMNLVEVSENAQIKVKDAVEVMTGGRVAQVNVHIKGSGIY